MSDIKTGFLIGLGVFLALALLGIVQSMIGRAVGSGSRSRNG